MTDLGRNILIGMTALSVALVLYLASPFAESLLMAAVLASTFSPWFEALARLLKQRRTLAGLLFLAAVTFVIVLPMVSTTLALAQQAEDAFRPLRANFQQGGMDAVFDGLPQPLPGIARRVAERLPRGGQQLEELLRSVVGKILGSAGHIFVATGNLLFQTLMMMVAFFFLLTEGPILVQWILRISPLKEGQMKELLHDFKNMSGAVLVGSVGTAFVQTLVALVGYWIAGARNALLLAALTFVGAFVPLVGAGAVVIGAALILFFTGHSAPALFLGIWGAVVVSSIDNLVKPYLMRGRLEVSTGVIFFALIGGATVFGPIGLLAGPLVIAFFLAMVRMCQKELSEVETDSGGDTV